MSYWIIAGLVLAVLILAILLVKTADRAGNLALRLEEDKDEIKDLRKRAWAFDFCLKAIERDNRSTGILHTAEMHFIDVMSERLSVVGTRPASRGKANVRHVDHYVDLINSCLRRGARKPRFEGVEAESRGGGAWAIYRKPPFDP